jgi:glycogenin glucosyltransferase
MNDGVIDHSYAPAYERYGDQISAIHFIGPEKPWLSIPWRVPGIRTSSESQISPFQPQDTAPQGLPAPYEPRRAYDYDSLVDRWFEVYDRHYRSQPVAPDPQFEVQRYASLWDDPQTSADDARAHGLGLDDLRRVALEGMNAASFVPGTASGEGDYTSMPLEGRIDLMPPKRDSTPKLVPTEALQVVQKTTELHSETETRTSPRLGEQPPSPRFYASPDRLPSTPDRPRMTTLPTPGPEEIPPAPYFAVLSLPPTPSPVPRHPRPGPESPLPQEHRTQQLLQPRLPSPPLLSWNPSVEPPPNVVPPSSSFPADTYFKNVWDQHGGRYEGDSSPEPPDALFQVPPFPEIPQQLLHQGHYRNVTGSSEDKTSPSPDRGKVKPLFPWESRPRHTPGRIFPDADEPPPGLFLPPLPGSPFATPERRRSRTYAAATPSPLAGLPTGFLNAWDTIPSTKPPSKFGRLPPPPLPLGPAFEDGSGRRASGGYNRWEDPADESSQDGDDEGEEIEHAEAPLAAGRRSRSSSISSVFVIKKGRREYRSRGMQTIEPERRSEGVQVTPQTLGPGVTRRNGTLEGHHPEAETGTSDLKSFPAMDVVIGAPVVPVQDPGLAAGLISPREFLYSHPHSLSRSSKEQLHIVTPPQQKPAMKGVSSLPSRVIDDTETSSVASPPSSLGPVSPPDVRSSGSPQLRKASRVFDPARGVDVFKRGSEEAWAKLLGMDSQDDGAQQ